MTKKKYYQLWKDYEELALQKKYNESYFDYNEEEYKKTRNVLIAHLNIIEHNIVLSFSSRDNRYTTEKKEKNLYLCQKLLAILINEECINTEDYNDTYELLEPRYLNYYTAEQLLTIAAVWITIIFLLLIFH